MLFKKHFKNKITFGIQNHVNILTLLVLCVIYLFSCFIGKMINNCFINSLETDSKIIHNNTCCCLLLLLEYMFQSQDIDVYLYFSF